MTGTAGVEIGPGSGKDLFEEMASWDFWPDGEDESSLIDCDFDSILELRDALQGSSPYRWKATSDPFSFLANSSLSGAGDPCFDPPTRVRQARELARFASLYADSVLLVDPFDALLYEEDSLNVRADLAVTLHVLEELRPAIESGLVLFAPTIVPLCECHRDDFHRSQDEYENAVIEVARLLTDELLSEIDVRIEKNSDYTYAVIRNLEEVLSVDAIDVVPYKTDGLDFFGDAEIATDELRREIIERFVLDSAVSDLKWRNLFCQWLNLRYLTNRPVDLDLLGLMDDRPAKIPTVSPPRIAHALPFIDGLDGQTLVELREKEGEAFLVYRDRVRQLTEEGSLGQAEFEEAFRDLVEPELRLLDRAVANARKIAKGEIRERLQYGVGLATVGLATGSISPEVGAVVGALGGAGLVGDLSKSLHRLVAEPPALRENDFYYLWRARNHAR